MGMWQDQETKKDAKELAAAFVEMHGWKGHVPDQAEKSVSECVRMWNTAMAMNVVLGQMVGHITPEGRIAADRYARIIGCFYAAIHPNMRDRRNITMEICVVGALQHLHERHAFMLSVNVP